MALDPNPTERSEQRLLDRMCNFSDAVFAFAMTLLVLDLRPQTTLDPGWAVDARARFAAFALSFAVISVFWAGHLTATRRLLRFDWYCFWINLAVIFSVVLMPFATSLLGSAIDPADGWRLYCAVIVALSLAQSALSLAIFRDRGRLVGGASVRERASRLVRAMSPGLAFTVGFLLTEGGRLDLARWCWTLILPLMIVARFVAPARPRSAAAA